MDHDEFEDKDLLTDEPTEDGEEDTEDDLSVLGFHEIDADGFEPESDF